MKTKKEKKEKYKKNRCSGFFGQQKTVAKYNTIQNNNKLLNF